MTELDPAVLVDAIRETGIALRPGDVLAVRLPSGVNHAEMAGARRYGQAIEAETGIKVAFIPGEEFASNTVNVTVNVTGDAGAMSKELAEAVRHEVQNHRRRNGGSDFA